jgi:hypothetical protein
MSTLDVTTAQVDTLRASQLREAAGTLDRVAGEFAATQHVRRRE